MHVQCLGLLLLIIIYELICYVSIVLKNLLLKVSKERELEEILAMCLQNNFPLFFFW